MRARVRLGLAAVLVGVGGACSLGTHEGNFEPALSPGGIWMELQVIPEGEGKNRRELEGELLAVGEDGLLLLVSRPGRQTLGKLTSVRYPAIRRAKPKQRGDLKFGDGVPPANDIRIELRRVSRYPQGVSTELLSRLLEIHGQGELLIISRDSDPQRADTRA